MSQAIDEIDTVDESPKSSDDTMLNWVKTNVNKPIGTTQVIVKSIDVEGKYFRVNFIKEVKEEDWIIPRFDLIDSVFIEVINRNGNKSIIDHTKK